MLVKGATDIALEVVRYINHISDIPLKQKTYRDAFPMHIWIWQLRVNMTFAYMLRSLLAANVLANTAGPRVQYMESNTV